MLHILATWSAAAAFFGAGLYNAIGTEPTRSSFARWGFPPWWCRVTGTLEMVVAALIAFPGTLEAGLILGGLIIAAAAWTVVRNREFSHLPPVGLFVSLLVMVHAAH
jgi:DoxX-like protein